MGTIIEPTIINGMNNKSKLLKSIAKLSSLEEGGMKDRSYKVIDMNKLHLMATRNSLIGK